LSSEPTQNVSSDNLEQLELVPPPYSEDRLEEIPEDYPEEYRVDENPLPIAENNSNEKTYSDYLIVLGSFSNENNAKSLQEKMTQIGLETEVTFLNDFFRVILASFKTEAEAKQKIQDIKNRHKIQAFMIKKEAK
jgi:cell division protein FtsN